MQESYLHSGGVIDPRSTNKILWDIMIIGLISYTLWAVPFTVGYRLSRTMSTYIWNLVICCAYFVDILFEFITAYKDETTDFYVFDRCKIRDRYLKFWFVFDLLAAIPYDIIINIIYGDSAFTLHPIHDSLVTSRACDFIKLLRSYKFGRISHILSDFHISHHFAEAQSLALKLFFIAHLLCCGWHFIATTDGNAPVPTVTFSNTSTISYANPTWIYNSASNLQDSAVTDRYIASIYFALTTMLTVGYGDFRAFNSDEQLFCIATELIGAVVFGAIVAEIVSFLKNIDPKRMAMKQGLNELMAYLTEKEIPLKLRNVAKVRMRVLSYVRIDICLIMKTSDAL